MIEIATAAAIMIAKRLAASFVVSSVLLRELLPEVPTQAHESVGTLQFDSLFQSESNCNVPTDSSIFTSFPPALLQRKPWQSQNHCQKLMSRVRARSEKTKACFTFLTYLALPQNNTVKQFPVRPGCPAPNVPLLHP